MKNSLREEVVNHSAKKLFDIVIDIENYPEYIPWCTKMVVGSYSLTSGWYRRNIHSAMSSTVETTAPAMPLKEGGTAQAVLVSAAGEAPLYSR